MLVSVLLVTTSVLEVGILWPSSCQMSHSERVLQSDSPASARYAGADKIPPSVGAKY